MLPVTKFLPCRRNGVVFKAFDASCPLGPWVETDLDLSAASDLAITCTVNGELRQTGRTSQMVHPIADLIVTITEAMTLLPKIERGDREAARRAMELVEAAGEREPRNP